MLGEKRIIMIEKNLNKIAFTTELETQKIRVKLIPQLEQLFNYAVEMGWVAENWEEWMRVAGYIAQVINSISNSFDETSFNEDVKR